MVGGEAEAKGGEEEGTSGRVMLEQRGQSDDEAVARQDHRQPADVERRRRPGLTKIPQLSN